MCVCVCVNADFNQDIRVRVDVDEELPSLIQRAIKQHHEHLMSNVRSAILHLVRLVNVSPRLLRLNQSFKGHARLHEKAQTVRIRNSLKFDGSFAFLSSLKYLISSA